MSPSSSSPPSKSSRVACHQVGCNWGAKRGGHAVAAMHDALAVLLPQPGAMHCSLDPLTAWTGGFARGRKSHKVSGHTAPAPPRDMLRSAMLSR
eukprot:296746-Chlamydomonas_euryale.AAC.6